MDSETESGDAFEMFSLFEDFKLTIEREKSIDSSRITKKICNNSINDLVSLGMALTNLVITDVEFGFGGKNCFGVALGSPGAKQQEWRKYAENGAMEGSQRWKPYEVIFCSAEGMFKLEQEIGFVSFCD